MRKKKSRPGKRFMQKYSVLPVCIVAGAILCIVLLISSLEAEPLTDDQILSKDKWQEEELVDTMVRVNMNRARNGTNPEVLRHLRRQVMKLPTDKRREITKKAVKRSLEKLQTGWKELEPEVRDKIIFSMRKQVQETRKRLKNLDEKRKERMREAIKDKDNQKWISEMQTQTINSLPPDLRREIAPLVKEWVKTIEAL